MIEWRSQNIRSWTINNSAATAQWHNLLCSLLDTAASKHRVTDRPPASQLASDKPSPDPGQAPAPSLITTAACWPTLDQDGDAGHHSHVRHDEPLRGGEDVPAVVGQHEVYEHRQSRGLNGTSTYSQSLVWILCYSKNSTFEVEELNYQGQTNLLPWDKNLSNLIRKIFFNLIFNPIPQRKWMTFI